MSETLTSNVVQVVRQEVESLIGEDRFRDILRCLEVERMGELRAIIEGLLAPLYMSAPGTADQESKLIRVRVVFDSAFLVRVCESEGSRQLLAIRLIEINDQMATLANSQYSDKSAIEFWNLDGRFHTEIGVFAGATRTGDIISLVQERIQHIGTARSCNTMLATVSEHSAIIDLLQQHDSPAWEDICHVVEMHSANAIERWKLHRLNPEAVITVDDARRGISPLLMEEVSNYYASLEACLQEEALLDIATQIQFQGHHVAWIDVKEKGIPTQRMVLVIKKSLADVSSFFSERVGANWNRSGRELQLKVKYLG